LSLGAVDLSILSFELKKAISYNNFAKNKNTRSPCLEQCLTTSTGQN
jgi:hypothetical protein